MGAIARLEHARRIVIVPGDADLPTYALAEAGPPGPSDPRAGG